MAYPYGGGAGYPTGTGYPPADPTAGTHASGYGAPGYYPSGPGGFPAGAPGSAFVMDNPLQPTGFAAPYPPTGGAPYGTGTADMYAMGPGAPYGGGPAPGYGAPGPGFGGGFGFAAAGPGGFIPDANPYPPTGAYASSGAPAMAPEPQYTFAAPSPAPAPYYAPAPAPAPVVAPAPAPVPAPAPAPAPAPVPAPAPAPVVGPVVGPVTGPGAGAGAPRVSAGGAPTVLRSDTTDREAENEYKNLATWRTPLDTLGLFDFLCRCTRPAQSPAGAQPSSAVTIHSEYGRGILMYFRYLQYLLAVNLVLSIPAAIMYGAARNAGPGLDPFDQYPSLSSTFIAAFPSEARPAWYTLEVFMVLIALGAGPLYRKFHQSYTQRWTGENREEEVDQHEDRLPENSGVTASSRQLRRIASVLITTCIVVGQGVAMYYLHEALADTDSDSAKAQVIGAVIAGLNALWKVLAKYVTTFERHATRTSYVEWDSGKIFFVRIGNMVSLYVVKYMTEGLETSGKECPVFDDGTDCRCPLRERAFQFFWLLIMEMSVGNVLSLAIPAATYWFARTTGWFKEHGDAAAKQAFDIAEEYTSVLYRQCIIYLGMTVFPLMPVLGFTAALLEFFLDKIRLVTLCQKPRIREEPINGKLVMAAHILIAVVAIASVPNGLGFVFAGFGIERNCNFWA